MNSKFAVLVLMGLGAATFGASYGLSLWLGPGPAPASASADASAIAAGGGPAAGEPAAPEATGREAVARLSENHLITLIRQVRVRLDECKQKEKALADQAQRLQVARDDLRQEAEGLETLWSRLTAATSHLKETQAALEQTRLAIRDDEKANLKHTAEIYDAMDAEAAAGIVESMCTNGQEADVVKILHLMQERNAAKLLAAVKNQELVANLCQKMKRVHEPKSEG